MPSLPRPVAQRNLIITLGLGPLGVERLTADFDSLEWRTSKACESSGCVEVASDNDVVLMRTSVQRDQVLSLTMREWLDFKTGVREGDFD